MDEVDLAQQHIERELEQRLAERKRERGLEPTGLCLWCDAGVGEGVRWCCAECRDDQDRADRARQRAGS